MIDTAINYRHMKSERVVGAALHYLLKDSPRLYQRDQLLVCSKSGFIPIDQDNSLTGE